ncbi:Wadjet anti-phage system protein JetD domain-containing protein [Paenarthrobacter sp. NPDC018779]|uniref:Wadjet anti-phage system protein JetD domain-containing protein n=1 Tax=Paenarthrobacter sp. NPDC018779 TaxID=3364375 RepID=UPI0037C4F800
MPAKAVRWTSLADLRALSVTAWDRGQLLREALEPTGLYPRRRTLKRPSATELRDSYVLARAWATELFDAAGTFVVETVDVGRTTIGANQLPAVAMFGSVEDEVAFVGKKGELKRFLSLSAALEALDPRLRSWALRRPLQFLALGDSALTAARVALWLRDNPSPGFFVRQLSLPGVHTKFIESHRRTIDEMVAMLDSNVEEPTVDPLADSPGSEDALLGPLEARTPAGRFAERHGFLHPPEQVRFLMLDPSITLLGGARDITVTASAFQALDLPVTRVIITENLVNFLSLPDLPGTLAIFGKGYGFSSLRDAAWLRSCEVRYWGDLDTHGFRILDQLRAIHPHVVSVLMDEETLRAHRDAWSVETSASAAVLSRLTPEEARVYKGLQSGAYGDRVRLEQELIGWEWALARLERNP